MRTTMRKESAFALTYLCCLFLLLWCITGTAQAADSTALVNRNNIIDASVQDSAGNTVVLGGDDSTVSVSYAVVQKPEEARVSVSTYSQKLQKDGTFRISFTADLPGIYVVETIVSNPHNGVYTVYRGKETILVREKELEPLSVIMTIGSRNLIVNGTVTETTDAPFIRDGRTFVPFRALAGTFGASVNYDAATRTVTAEQNGINVKMNIDSTICSVNGIESIMDTVPFIENGRTYVPVRFFATAFGLQMDTTSKEDGSTATVIFKR